MATHHEKLAELERVNPLLATLYEQQNAAALAFEARQLREAEEKATLEGERDVLPLFKPGSKLAALAAMRTNGHHLMADMFENNNAYALRLERDELAREAPPELPPAA